MLNLRVLRREKNCINENCVTIAFSLCWKTLNHMMMDMYMMIKRSYCLVCLVDSLPLLLLLQLRENHF